MKFKNISFRWRSFLAVILPFVVIIAILLLIPFLPSVSADVNNQIYSNRYEASADLVNKYLIIVFHGLLVLLGLALIAFVALYVYLRIKKKK